MEIKESILISHPPKNIWDFWMLVTTDVQWRDGITKTEWTSQPPYGIGSTGAHYHKDFGAIPWAIIKWEDGRHVEWVLGECKMKGSIGYYHVEPENGGSQVTICSNLKLPFFMRILMIFMGGKMKKKAKVDLQKLKAIMEK